MTGDRDENWVVSPSENDLWIGKKVWDDVVLPLLANNQDKDLLETEFTAALHEWTEGTAEIHSDNRCGAMMIGPPPPPPHNSDT